MSAQALVIPQERLSPPSILVYRISPKVLPLFWPQAKPLLVRALARVHGRYRLENVRDWLLAGSHDLWVAAQRGRVRAIFLTEITTHPSGKRMFDVLLTAGADARQWVRPAFEQMTEYARLHGVTEFRVCGRPGWARYLAPLGFKQECVLLTRDEEV